MLCIYQLSKKKKQKIPRDWGHPSPEAENVKGCCAGVIFGPKLCVGQNKSRYPKMQHKVFQIQYDCLTFHNFFRQLQLQLGYGKCKTT